MKLSNAALTAVTGKRKTLLSLALALNISEQWMRRVLENNKSNGPLTTVTALAIIREETGLTDSDILESEVGIKQEDSEVVA
jgi:hypothetical protein